MLTRGGVGAEKLDVRELHVQLPQAVADDLVGHVAVEVDDEAVGAEGLLCRPRLELGEVDAPRGELAEDLVQAAGSVVPLETDDARPVVSRRSGNAVRRDEDKTRLVVRMILDALGEQIETVELGRQGGSERRRSRRVLL